MRYAILGGLQARGRERELVVAGLRPRAVLVVLLLHRNEVVSTEALVDALWGEQSPATATKIVQNAISQLRKEIAAAGEPADGALVSHGHGYELRVASGELDLDRFEALVAQARGVMDVGDAQRAAAILREALALWRGAPLADVAYEPFAQAEIARLEERRLFAVEARIEADLGAGRHAELVGELEALIRSHPLRERLRAALMLALYRSGRQAEALQVYQDTRGELVEQLGVEPGQALRDLQRQILDQDAALDPEGVPQLPGGTVTFLFSDIEGSTRLLTRLRDRYGEVLGTHQRLLRAAFADNNGREVNTEGDGFFVVFERASDAVNAAVSLQRALASWRWPDGVEVRVRMGIHSGEAEFLEDDYVGLDVHRAARISAAGHGGQVLISSSTRELVGDQLPDDVALKDLGEHRLKDLIRPEHLFQLVIGGLPTEFPMLASLPGSSGRNRLPLPANPTIGRADDVHAIVGRLRADGARLVTLTGPGGIGKTRLVLEAAHAVEADFADGAYFVALGALQRPTDVPLAIVKTLGIVVLAGESAAEAAERFLAGKRLLLVVDNFEHVLAAAPLIAGLLGACPALKVLATSREALRLQAEASYAVSPLDVPARKTRETAEALAAKGAVALFRARARAHDPGFDLDDVNMPAVAEICRRLDGLPLAIELAAARCGLLSPDEIAERLDDTLGGLGTGVRDAPARQRTLRATIDWSHELLNDTEKRCFARFSVFCGGATVQAAETIAAADVDALDGLMAKSLLFRQGPDGPSRLGMLETVRAYASDRLNASGDAQAVRDRHYRHYLALAQRHGSERVLWSAAGKDHLARIDAEIDNLHAALGWAIQTASAECALMMTSALCCYWDMRVRSPDAVIDWIEQALDVPGADVNSALWLPILKTKAGCLWAAGRASEQPAVLAELEMIARRLNDPAALSRALTVRASYAVDRQRLDVADAVADEAFRLATEAGDEWQIADASRVRASAAANTAELRARVDTAASLLADVGNIRQLANLLTSAAYDALNLGSAHDATDFATRAAPIVRTLDNDFARMVNNGNLGLAALLTGDTDAAADAFGEELSLCREMVVRPVAFEGLRGLAAIAVVHGDAMRAATLVGAANAQCNDQPQDPVEARLDDTFFEPARTRWGIDAWNAAAHTGSTLSFHDAIAYALDEAG